MKAFLAKYKWKLLCAFVLLVIVVPVAINCLFKIKSPYNFFVAEWGAGDVLAFYGAMLASATTIIGVYISIEYAQRNYRVDEANRVRPYFALTHYRARSKANLLVMPDFNPVDEDADEPLQSSYEEYKVQRVYVIIKKEEILYMGELPKELKKQVKFSGYERSNSNNGIQIRRRRDYISLPFDAVNVGNGAATNTMIAVYKEGGEFKGINLYTIKQEDAFYFHIYYYNPDAVAGDSYIIELRYNDILGNHYSQKYPLTVIKNAGTERPSATIDFTGKQEKTDMDTEEKWHGETTHGIAGHNGAEHR